ncbi:GNAT family N-acetyltransferase [Aquiflexum gelatinilyticum]|uniref:GNAT family N-acetyltransferase n=1 Tax=Aquiflexum gelatinilyticum TaxID=2961943 RepID=UPI002167D02E|nr:GNAT family N-acetyltransferase [Aquiflexum gelatinilyticum]MCS4434546.1 GNAT family N-acetyltransferase [Aquiflexum gelatinilyticum]
MHNYTIHPIFTALEIKFYSPSDFESWNELVENSSNGIFLHSRNFMDYHRDRFTDVSLLIKEGEELVAVLPGNSYEKTFLSHQGLTFGGWIFRNGIDFVKQQEIILRSLQFLSEKGFTRIRVKPVPEFYHSQKTDNESLMVSCGGVLVDEDPNYAIELPKVISDRGKRWGVQKAMNMGIHIEEDDGFVTFWDEILMPYHKQVLGYEPVHTLAEIEYLAANNPGKIRQFNAYHKGEILAGVTVFSHPEVARTQYIASTDDGRKNRAVDLLIGYLMRHVGEKYIDLGGVTDPKTGLPKESLVQWKESFGGVLYMGKVWEFG